MKSKLCPNASRVLSFIGVVLLIAIGFVLVDSRRVDAKFSAEAVVAYSQCLGLCDSGTDVCNDGCCIFGGRICGKQCLSGCDTAKAACGEQCAVTLLGSSSVSPRDSPSWR